MNIPNPRRILILSPPDTPIASVLNALSPSPSTTTATTPTTPPSLLHQITTPYYSALIPIWTDTLLLPAWPTAWQHPSARPVISAIGAFVLVVRKPGCEAEVRHIRGLLRAVNAVVGGWEGVRVVVGVRRGMVGGAGENMGRRDGGEEEEEEEEAWERMAREEGGWEWVDGEVDMVAGGRRRGEFRELTGLARLKEALETNEWEAADADDLELELGGLEVGEEEAGEGFEAEAAEVHREMVEMRRAVYEGGGEREEEDGAEGRNEEGGDIQVEELESMMLKMQAIRDMGADMPSSERKKFAAAAVRDIMKSI